MAQVEENLIVRGGIYHNHIQLHMGLSVSASMPTPVQSASENWNWTLKPGTKVSRFYFHHLDSQGMSVPFSRRRSAQRRTVERQASGRSVMLWAMLRWEILGSGSPLDVNLTCHLPENVLQAK